jgi:hypothetical protein
VVPVRKRALGLITTIGIAASSLALGGLPASAGPADCDQPNSHVLDAGQTRPYVREVYRTMFGREAEQAGEDYWSDLLDRGVPRITMTCYFAYHPEFLAAWLTSSYQAYLGRDPDQSAIDHFAGELAAGRLSSMLIDVVILGSEEYLERSGGTPSGFVEGLYRDVLGREADADGRAFWTEQLGQGKPRWWVALLVVFSGENAQRWVVHLLNRHVAGFHGQEEVAYWVGRHQANGSDVLATLAEVLASVVGVAPAD